jgi:ABC-2 type transport system permease protein
MVFSTKDSDFLLSLPLPAWQVLFSRIFALYLDVLVLIESFLIPTGIVYAVFAYGKTSGFWVPIISLPVLGIFLAFIPTFISLAFGGLISFAVAKLPFKNFFSTLFNLIILAGIIVVSISFSFIGNYTGRTVSSGGDLGIIVNMRDQIVSAMPALEVFAQAATGENIFYAFLCALVCTLPFALVLAFLAAFYKRLISSLASTSVQTNYRLGRLRQSAPVIALLKKEALKLFRTPGYLFNAGGMPILFIIASLVAVFFRGRIIPLLASFDTATGGLLLPNLPGYMLLLILFFIGLILISAVSISLEGANFWILKTSPVPISAIFSAKILFNAVFSGVFSILTLSFLSIAAGFSLSVCLVMIFIALLTSLCFSQAGFIMNLRFPKMDATNDIVVIKQSASVLTAMLADWAVLLSIFLLSLVCKTSLMRFIAISTFLVVLCIVFGLIINGWGKRKFARI